MTQRRISMRERPLGELFRSTATAPTGEKNDAVRAARGRGRCRWHWTALAVLAIATLELGMFVAVAVALLTRPRARATTPLTPPTVTRTVVIRSAPTPFRPPLRNPPVVPLAPRAQTPVLVLNGNGIKGAAATSAEIVRARGYPVTATTDAPRWNYPQTVVMYKPGFAGEAKRLARDLNILRLQPLDPLAVPGGTGARLVLIVGGGHD
jgi:hypothetical protein